MAPSLLPPLVVLSTTVADDGRMVKVGVEEIGKKLNVKETQKEENWCI